MSALDLAIVDHPLLDEHRSLEPHPERPERLMAARRAAASVAARAGRVDVRFSAASDDELVRVHTASYLERLGQAAGSTTQFDEDTYSAPKSVEAARTAAGGAVALVDALLARQALRGVALLRPPGHHARPDGAMGFCLLNNVAVAAAHARARGVGRVLVLDFDVHHGNGTQEMFYEHPEVLFVSTHQFPFYPGSGSLNEAGAANGRGYTLNVPLSRGSDDATYAAAFDRIIAPVVSEFAPGLVLLSAGFDAHKDDPLGQMNVTESGYRAMMRQLLAALPADTPIGAVLEGGYNLRALELSLTATLEILVGLDPEPVSKREGETEVSPSQIAMPPSDMTDVDRAQRAAAQFWNLG